MLLYVEVNSFTEHQPFENITFVFKKLICSTALHFTLRRSMLWGVGKA